MCRTFPNALTAPAAVGGYPNAPPESRPMPRAVPSPAPDGTDAPWGTLAAIDCTAARPGGSRSPKASARSCRR